jgi:hypothetical protein
VFMIAPAEAGSGHAGFVCLYALCGACEVFGGFENAGAEEFGQELQLIGGKTLKKAPRTRPQILIGTGEQRSDERISRDDPVTNHTEWL